MRWSPREQQLLSALRSRETWERWGEYLRPEAFPSQEARKVRRAIEKLHHHGNGTMIGTADITRAMGETISLDPPLPMSFVEQWVLENELVTGLGRISKKLEHGGEIGKEEFTAIVERLTSLGSHPSCTDGNHSPLTLEELFDGKGFESRGTIPTFLSEHLDDYLGGGIGRGQLCVLAAPPKRGKTTCLIQIAYRAAAKGFRTLFLSCENYLDQLQERFTQVHQLHRRKRPPALHVQYHSQMTVEDVERYVRNVKPDFVVVDYEGTMGSKTENDFTWRTVEIYSGLRNVAGRHDVVLWTASQAHEPQEYRQGGSIERRDNWGSDTKIQFCDLFLGFNTVPQLNRGYLKVLARRGKGKEGKEFRVHFNADTGDLKDG